MRCVNAKMIYPYRSIEWCDVNEEYPISVPCGKCMVCLSAKRSEWILRLEQEFKYSSGAMFITLTFDRRHYPSDGSLSKRDVQLYLKRLRKSVSSRSTTYDRIRYFAVGEYGGKTGRAHYHILLFNCNDEVAVRSSWCDSKGASIGMVHIGQVTQASIAYCTKYIIQVEIPVEGIQAPFRLMSRAFGIGGRYLSDAMVAWHRDGDKNYVLRDGLKVRLPRFYKSKIWYSEKDRERVSKKALLESLQADLRMQAELGRKYGSRGPAKYIEMRNAMLSRVKQKVAFSQSI